MIEWNVYPSCNSLVAFSGKAKKLLWGGLKSELKGFPILVRKGEQGWVLSTFSGIYLVFNKVPRWHPLMTRREWEGVVTSNPNVFKRMLTLTRRYKPAIHHTDRLFFIIACLAIYGGGRGIIRDWNPFLERCPVILTVDGKFSVCETLLGGVSAPKPPPLWRRHWWAGCFEG